MNINLALALLNVILCWWRFVAALRARRLTSIPWFLLAYFSIFFIPVSLEESISWTRGFFAEAVTAGPEEIHRAILFVVLFNMVFSFADKVGELLIARRGPQAIWILPSRTATLNKLSRILGGLWVVGSAWYFWTTRTQNYRDYVEGSSWAIVLFWASSPLITMLAMQKRWLPATVLCVPFIYFALHLQVRSFALLSLVPVIVVGFYQIASDPAARLRFARTIRYGVVGGIALVTLSIWVSKYKTG
ncbi:MAG: hypothetical protein NT025_00275, partial [bacterium]|nr:hypothetical protein [bacterium]